VVYPVVPEATRWASTTATETPPCASTAAAECDGGRRVVITVAATV
jgi:hypothetical protein